MLLAARGLSLHLNSRRIIDDVALQIEAGEIVGLLGSNRAGKTTLLRMLAGLLKPDAGSVLFQGREVVSPPEGLVFIAQEVPPFQELTVEQDLRAALKYVDDLGKFPAEALLLLLDEPFSGVDPVHGEALRTLIRRLAMRGVGILLTDHNVRDALDLVDRAYILLDGRLAMSGTASALLSSL